MKSRSHVVFKQSDGLRDSDSGNGVASSLAVALTARAKVRPRRDNRQRAGAYHGVIVAEKKT